MFVNGSTVFDKKEKLFKPNVKLNLIYLLYVIYGLSHRLLNLKVMISSHNH